MAVEVNEECSRDLLANHVSINNILTSVISLSCEYINNLHVIIKETNLELLFSKSVFSIVMLRLLDSELCDSVLFISLIFIVNDVDA